VSGQGGTAAGSELTAAYGRSPLTTHDSQLTTHNSPLTTHDSHLLPLTTHNSRLPTDNSQLPTHNSQLTAAVPPCLDTARSVAYNRCAVRASAHARTNAPDSRVEDA